MAHIVFCTPASSGHVNPTLGVVAELVGRGHRVSYASTRQYAPRLAAAGATVLRYDEVIGAEFRSFRFSGGSLIDSMTACLRQTASVFPMLRDRLDDDRPDLVVCDNGAWWGRLLAAHWRVPAALSCPMFVDNEHWSMGDRYARISAWHPKLWLLFARLSSLLRRHRIALTPAQVVTGAGLGCRLVYLPREFQYAGDTFDDGHHFVGPCFGPRGFLGEWREPEHDGPLLLATLGTIYNRQPDHFRTVIDACADLPCHLVVAVGDGVELAALRPWPAHVEVHRFVPQLTVLAAADLFLTHAGMGSTMEALYHGVPMLAMPQMAEESANADRIAQLGLGRTLPTADRTAGRIRAEIESMLADRTLRPRLAAMRDATRTAGGAPAAADRLDTLLKGPQ